MNFSVLICGVFGASPNLDIHGHLISELTKIEVAPAWDQLTLVSELGKAIFGGSAEKLLFQDNTSKKVWIFNIEDTLGNSILQVGTQRLLQSVYNATNLQRNQPFASLVTRIRNGQIGTLAPLVSNFTRAPNELPKLSQKQIGTLISYHVASMFVQNIKTPASNFLMSPDSDEIVPVDFDEGFQMSLHPQWNTYFFPVCEDTTPKEQPLAYKILDLWNQDLLQITPEAWSLVSDMLVTITTFQNATIDYNLNLLLSALNTPTFKHANLVADYKIRRDFFFPALKSFLVSNFAKFSPWPFPELPVLAGKILEWSTLTNEKKEHITKCLMAFPKKL